VPPTASSESAAHTDRSWKLVIASSSGSSIDQKSCIVTVRDEKGYGEGAGREVGAPARRRARREQNEPGGDHREARRQEPLNSA